MDGSPAGVDCDDTNPRRTPGARERCDGVDNDCNTLVDDGRACGLWVHTGASRTWAAYALDAAAESGAPSPHAPTNTVRAALDIESVGIAYVLTDTRYHVLEVASRRWIESGARDALFPQLAGRLVLTGYTVPAGHGGGDRNLEGATVLAATGAMEHSFDIAMRRFTFVRDAGIPVWMPAADAPQYSQLRAVWLELTNADDWVTFAPSSLCAMGGARVGPYAAAIAGSRVHVIEAGACFLWGPPQPYAGFTPFARPGAPTLDRVAATFYQSGSLYVLGSP
jgi:hypothetical protein